MLTSSTYTDKNGYLRYSDTGKLVHRDIAKRKYGTISKWDQVHHIDGNKINNSPSNLIKLSKTEHEIMHMKNPKSVEFSYKLDYVVGKVVASFVKKLFGKR